LSQKRGAGRSFLIYCFGLPHVLRSKSKSISPAAPTPAAVHRHLEHAYRKNVRRYERCLISCRQRLSRKPVHQLRVSIRRLLACLELLEISRPARPAVRGNLRRQLLLLGSLRDTQVQLRSVKAEARLALTLHPLVELLRRRERRLAKAVLKGLHSDQTLHRLKRQRGTREPDLHHLVPRLRRLIDHKLQEAFDPLGSFSRSRPVDGKAHHRIRVLAREYRCQMEALPPDWRRGDTGLLLSTLGPFQEIIGRIHDREVLRHRISHWIDAGKLPAGEFQPLGDRLLTENGALLEACGNLDRPVFHAAMLALRQIRRPGAASAGRRFSAAIPPPPE